jgi:hypothetical protein
MYAFEHWVYASSTVTRMPSFGVFPCTVLSASSSGSSTSTAVLVDTERLADAGHEEEQRDAATHRRTPRLDCLRVVPTLSGSLTGL